MTTPRPDTWMPLYWGDYLRDTGHLDAQEHGAYLMLIGHYWTTGKPLPNDDRKLSRIARVSPRDWTKIRPTISEFFSVLSECWTHNRIEKELSKSLEKMEQKRNAGRSSAAAKAQRTFNGRSTDVGTDVGTEHPTEGQLRARASPSPSPSQVDSSDRTDLKGTEGNGALTHPPPAHLPAVIQPSPEEIKNLWNEIAVPVGLPRVDKISAQRRNLIGARLRDAGGIDGLRAVFQRVADSPWCRGEMNGRDHPNWRADFDFVLTERSFIKICEGKYDDRQANGKTHIIPQSPGEKIFAGAYGAISERDREREYARNGQRESGTDIPPLEPLLDG